MPMCFLLGKGPSPAGTAPLPPPPPWQFAKRRGMSSLERERHPNRPPRSATRGPGRSSGKGGETEGKEPLGKGAYRTAKAKYWKSRVQALALGL